MPGLTVHAANGIRHGPAPGGLYSFAAVNASARSRSRLSRVQAGKMGGDSLLPELLIKVLRLVNFVAHALFLHTLLQDIEDPGIGDSPFPKPEQQDDHVDRLQQIAAVTGPGR